MRKIISAVLALCIVGGALPVIESFAPKNAAVVYAEDYTEVTEGDLTYAVYEDHAEVKKCDRYAEGNLIIPSEVNSVPVTAIQGSFYSIFKDCVILDSITLPDTITEIGGYAFYGCDWLKSIELPNNLEVIGVGAFRECKNLTNIKLPDSLSEIYDGAFHGCEKLEKIVVPKGVTKIRKGVFANCDNLSSVTLPDALTEIEESAFYHCINLKTISIPQNVIAIGKEAFSNCCNLESINILKGVKAIENAAFYYCIKLKSIELPDSVKIIEQHAFSNCYALEEAIIPDSVKSISMNAFEFCPLKKLTIPDDYKNIITTVPQSYIVTTIADNNYRLNSKGKTMMFYTYTTIAKAKTTKNSTNNQATSTIKTTTTTAVTQPMTSHPVGDVNGDNIVDGRDASYILSYYAKVSTGYTGTITDYLSSQGE